MAQVAKPPVNPENSGHSWTAQHTGSPAYRQAGLLREPTFKQRVAAPYLTAVNVVRSHRRAHLPVIGTFRQGENPWGAERRGCSSGAADAGATGTARGGI